MAYAYAMKPVLWFVFILFPLLCGCGREPQRVPARDGWVVADYPPTGSLRVGLFALKRASLTTLDGRTGNRNPALIIEPRGYGAPGDARIEHAAQYVIAPVGPPVMLDVSFDGGPPEPIAFGRGNMDLETTRAFVERLQSHRTITITLPGAGEYFPPGVLTYSLDGLRPQLAALDAEYRARREGVGIFERILTSLSTAQ